MRLYNPFNKHWYNFFAGRFWKEYKKQPNRRERMAEAAEYRCKYCEYVYPLDQLTLDHVVPRAAGGSNDESNLVIACRACNNFKSDFVKRNGTLVRYSGTYESRKKKRLNDRDRIERLKEYRRKIARKHRGI